MKRRTFLAGCGAALATPALAQMDHSGMGHAMQGMDSTAMPMNEPAAAGPGPVLPEGRAFVEVPRLANASAAPGTFAATITAGPAKAGFAEGVETAILAYNGQSPGPLIEVTEGDAIRIRFENRIPDEPSTIHWHGLPVPADQDGNPMDAVASGESRDYDFTVPEGAAGSYWYHPHPHGLTAEQVYRGLAGPFVVKAKADSVPAAYGDTVLFFTDLRLAPDGSIPENTLVDLMNGRVGDHVLVNGLKNPVLTLLSGTIRRFRLYNATNARYLRLGFGNLPITVIGTDGGLLETPLPPVADILLAPAERLEILVKFDKPGDVRLQTLDYDRGWMGPSRPDDAGMTLLTVTVAHHDADQPPALPEKLRTIAPLGAPVVSRKVVFGETMSMDTDGMSVDFTINGQKFDMQRVDFQSKAGDVELWQIDNPTDMDHPFHIHGTQFQLLDVTQGGTTRKASYLAWKDTINVPRGASVRIALRQDLPGPRMFHCHILEHEQLGMMGIVEVQPA